MSYFTGWWDNDTPDGDGVPPTITLVSPEEFDESYATARNTPVVIDVADSTGLGPVTILVSGAGFSDQQVVYNNGGFVAPFSSGTRTSITDGYRFSFLPTHGWLPGELEIFVFAVDDAGAYDTETFTWDVDSPEASDDNTGGVEFRDRVWRWRRRLNRQKCSVISVAIDDNYTAGPGFTLTALALEIGRRPGLDRVPWRGGTNTNSGTSGTNSDGT
jgi:hypothetical protein